MEGCRLSTEWEYRGLKTLVMENQYLRAVILMDHGGKLHELTYKPSDRDFLYHHPRLLPRKPVFGVNVDDWWTGGVDTAIPTGHVCQFRGDTLPYLGEVWSQPWQWQVVTERRDHIEVYSRCSTIISPFLVERWDALYAGERFFRQRYRVTNTGYSEYPFLWGIHPGFAVTPASRIDLPARQVVIEESLPANRLGPPGASYLWPFAKDGQGQAVDMRQALPPESGVCEFHYAVELEAGWLALTDSARREGIALVFPKEVFSVVWLWLVYGGWRDIYTAAVEAWTGYPARLTEALARGRCSRLQAGETLEAEVKFVAFDGCESVSHITPDGVIHSGITRT